MRKVQLKLSATVAATALTAALSSAAFAQTPQTSPQPSNHNRLTPFVGEISPFWGEISPFWGEISPFWGEISPFWGEISPFWGEISPFWGEISPFWGEISPFWGEISPFVSDLHAQWGEISRFTGVASPDHAALQAQFQQLVSQSEAFWGPTISARTGQDFWNGFAKSVFAKHGIDLNDPSTFDGFDGVARDKFFFDWYDGLMSYSGRDHVDHWMATVNWAPALTQQHGGGDTVLGLIDMVSPKDLNADKTLVWRGFDTPAGGHGGAVASLLVSAHDGKGLMGMAPEASVVAVNPFDHTGTASWEAVRDAVTTVLNNRASVVNLSLGTPGYTFSPQWFTQVYRPVGQNPVSKTIFVHAAGNDGIAQTEHLHWNVGATNHLHLIVVGSVGPDETISSFSNRPGNVCLRGVLVLCETRLMDRFIVAPGEWILVTDGDGGVTRQSGTSFAAPLVTGTIGLIHDRWPWLRNSPALVANVILGTAKDLGAPGTDPVYGRGLLDVEAALAPFDFNQLWYKVSEGGRLVDRRLSNQTVNNRNRHSRVISVWNVPGGYLVGFEYLSSSTQRDFLIPIDQKLLGTSLTVDGREELFQSFLHQAFLEWVRATGGFVQREAPSKTGLAVRFGALPFASTVRENDLPYAVDVAMFGKNGLRLNAGRGYGAVALHGGTMVDGESFDLFSGGVNPILGLASGGAYAAVSAPAPFGFEINAGFSTGKTELFYVDPASGAETPLYDTLDPYQAQAAHVSLRRPIGERAAVTLAYTVLNEEAGLLGMQSLNPDDLAEGSRTEAAILGLDLAVSPRVSLSASATLAATDEAGQGQVFALDDRMRSSAYEASVRMTGLFGRGDVARLKLSQPLFVETGSLDLSMGAVVDRQTGEIGVVTQSFAVDGGPRRLVLEGQYATPILGGHGETGLFARFEQHIENGRMENNDALVGGQVKLTF